MLNSRAAPFFLHNSSPSKGVCTAFGGHEAEAPRDFRRTAARPDRSRQDQRVKLQSMLLSKPLNQLTAEDIRSFCLQHPEGLRVEYKQDLSIGVRTKIPAIIASFANSYGGVLIVGARTERASVVEPIEGYSALSEETKLTVENICLQHLNLPFVPRIREVPSDVEGRCFLVVEIDESPEAPHAIENSRKVYIRTGDGNTPYDLADISTIERLLGRRTQVLARWNHFQEETERLFRGAFEQLVCPKLRVMIGPQYPAVELGDREQVLQFAKRIKWDGSLANQQVYREPLGACGLRKSADHKSLMRTTIRGQMFFLHDLGSETMGAWSEGTPTSVEVYPFSRVTGFIHRDVSCAFKLLGQFGFVGRVAIDLLIFELDGVNFTLNDDFADLLTSFAPEVPAKLVTESKSDSDSINEIVSAIMFQLVWPFASADYSVTQDKIREHVSRQFSNPSRFRATLM